MKISALLILGFLLPLISAQLTYYDNGYPPAPATRRISIRTNQFIGRRSAAIQQAPIEVDEPEQQISQQHQEPQELEEPIVQEQVPTQRPLRNGNGFSQQPVPSRNGNGYTQKQTNGNGFSRIPQQPVYEGVAQTTVTDDEGTVQTDVSQQSQELDSGLTDAPKEDVSTENVVPSVATSSEDTTDDGFTPTEPQQQPLVANVQRPINGNGQKPTNGQKPINGRKTINGNGKKAVSGNVGQKPVNGNGQKPVNGNGQKMVNGGGQTQEEEHHSSGGDHDHHSGDPIQWLRDAIRGEPGTDYPIFFSPPETAFKCTDQQWPGYYADVEARCQVFHICQPNGRSDAFLCPNGTVFSQQNFVCVWWFDFDCATAPQFYELNSQLYAAPEAKSNEKSTATDGPTDGPADGPAEERTTTAAAAVAAAAPGDSAEGQEPDSPQVTEQLPSVGPVSEDSLEAVSEETPAEEVVPTTTLVGLRSPQKGGIKGKNGNGQRTNGKSTGLDGISLKMNGNGNGKRLNGNGVAKNGAKKNGNGVRNGVTTKPVNGNGRQNGNGNGKKNGNGAPVIPASPATSGRQKTNGQRVNGNGQQRVNVGTKSAYRPVQQKTELDEESSNRYYRRRYYK